MHYSLAANNNNWEVALRNQIEETARRNSGHKKYAQVEDRTKVCMQTVSFSVFLKTWRAILMRNRQPANIND